MQETIKNRTIFCKDNLDILEGINTETIDLVYLDPPFNKKKVFTAPIGTSAEGASFKDIFTEADLKEEWVQEIREDWPNVYELLNAVKNIEGRSSYNFCYLAYMAIRLIECHRVLKNTGSVYLHCDATMSHYLKLLLDCIFGEKNFKNEIVWCYTGPSNTKRYYPRKHDSLFFYVKNAQDNYIFNTQAIKIPYAKLETGKTGGIFKQAATLHKAGKIPEDWWEENRDNMTPVGRIQTERTGYPTQKPLALLERIIKASSSEGDVVLDPFCGCATTCVAAERLSRRWIGIDVSVKAYELVQERIRNMYEIRQGKLEEGELSKTYFSTTAPTRTDDGANAKDQKYVYIISHPQYEGEYKVGIASDVKSRLSSYQTSDPNRDYKLEYKQLTEHYRALERHIHNQFDSRQEWVRAEMQEIINAMKSYRP